MGQIVEWFNNPVRAVFYSRDRGDKYYWERVNRNIGYITEMEQRILRGSVVGIAGNGGMGALVGAIAARVGVGEVRLADSETFDISNIQRQFAARIETVGKSKALSTAEEVRRITDDVKLIAYPSGICPETIEHFMRGCDVVLDEIEVFALNARLLLHKVAKRLGTPVLNCNTVGYGSRLFLFTPETMYAEEMLGISYEEAEELVWAGHHSSKKSVREMAFARIGDLMTRGFFPELPKYKKDDLKIWHKGIRERRVRIIGTNPPMASGFLADRTAMFLLRNSGVKRLVQEIPLPPGYLYLDVAQMEAKAVKRAKI